MGQTLSEPRLRVLMLCQLFHPLIYGGGEVQFWSLAKALVSRGHEVYVVTQRVSGLKDNEEVCGVKIVRVGTPVRYVGALTTSFLDSLAYFLEACWAGIRIAGAKRINIVHSNTYIPAFAGQLCASLLKMAHVMTVHDVYLAALPWFWPKWSQQRGVGISARALGPLLERTILRLPVDVIHTVSEASKHDLVEMGVQNSIVIVPDCIDPLEYKQDEPLSFNRHQAIYIGRLVFYKNLDVVFRAFSRVIENVPDAQLSIVGEGPMKQSWERMVRQRGLKEHITFHGRVSNEQKIRLLNESAYLILPSLIEGFGIVILEAFA
jgi:glycosyltransferase involved in cell wall biosynthesis